MLLANTLLIEEAAKRSSKLSDSKNTFDAKKCIDAIKAGKIELNNKNLKEKARTISEFKVWDLLKTSKRPVRISDVKLNENLSLFVKPSGGVRAVRLELSA